MAHPPTPSIDQARSRRHVLVMTPVVACLLLAGCGRAASDPASGGLTVGESEKLEAAAHRLDARAAPPGRAASAELEADVSSKLAEEKPAN